MASLILRDGNIDPASALLCERVVPLREWLEGNWAAVFSDPDDFAPPPSTPAGFVTCIAEGVRAAGIKPIAFGRCLEPLPTSWLDHAVNDDAIVLLESEAAAIVDLAEHALTMKLARLNQSFVLILDDRGRVQTTLRYRAGDRSRSMIDVVELVAVLRDGPRRALSRAHVGAA